MATRIKRIEDHSDKELDFAIQKAANSFCLFWIVLHGVDAFLERRARRKERAEHRIHEDAMRAVHEDKSWGNS